MVLGAVADHFGLTVAELVGKRRAGSPARHVAIAVLKSTSVDASAAIRQAFGVTSHSSVAYACEQVAQYRAQDQALDRFVTDLLLRVECA